MQATRALILPSQTSTAAMTRCPYQAIVTFSPLRSILGPVSCQPIEGTPCMKLLALLLLCGIACAQTQVIPLPVTPAPIAPPAVQPPLVQPAAVTSPPLTLTATSTTCTVTGGAQTVSIAVPATPVTPPVMLPVVPSSIVYQNGLINWTFNMSYGATVNYRIPWAPRWGMMVRQLMSLPGEVGNRGSQFLVRTAGRGVSTRVPILTSYSRLSPPKPTRLQSHHGLAQTGRCAERNPGLAIGQYCVAAVGSWGSCKIPLNAFAFPTPLVSKFALQSNLPAVFYVNNVGFQ